MTYFLTEWWVATMYTKANEVLSTHQTTSIERPIMPLKPCEPTKAGYLGVEFYFICQHYLVATPHPEKGR